jgi:cytochrome c-type biogenesis protein CcmE
MAGMKGLKKRRRVQVLALAAVAVIAATALAGYGFREGINFYRAPSDVAATQPDAAEVFRMGGLVEPGSITRGAGTEVSFRVTDGGAAIPVRFTGVLPDLFEEGQGTVVRGRIGADGVFVADEVLAKHDETYMPKEVIDSLKAQGVYRDPDAEDPGS